MLNASTVETELVILTAEKVLATALLIVVSVVLTNVTFLVSMNVLELLAALVEITIAIFV
jgi:hypothetical protein